MSADMKKIKIADIDIFYLSYDEPNNKNIGQIL